MVRKVLHSLTQEYLRKLIESKPALSADFFDRLKGDQVMLDAFFMRYAELAGEQFVTNELSFLQLIQELLQADIDSLPLHFDKIADTWPDKGASVIETLAALRSDISKAERKAVVEHFNQTMHARHAKQQQQQQAGAKKQQAANGGVVDLLSSDAGRSASSSSAFLNSNGFFGVFKSRGKPVKKGKRPASGRRGRNNDKAGAGRRPEGETLSLEDFLK